MTATVSSVNGSASAVTLVTANSRRKALYVYNDSTAALYLKLGTAASTTSFTVKIETGGFYELPTMDAPNSHIYEGVVTGIWASATGAARITEVE